MFLFYCHFRYSKPQPPLPPDATAEQRQAHESHWRTQQAWKRAHGLKSRLDKLINNGEGRYGRSIGPLGRSGGQGSTGKGPEAKVSRLQEALAYSASETEEGVVTPREGGREGEAEAGETMTLMPTMEASEYGSMSLHGPLEGEEEGGSGEEGNEGTLGMTVGSAAGPQTLVSTGKGALSLLSEGDSLSDASMEHQEGNQAEEVYTQKQQQLQDLPHEHRRSSPSKRRQQKGQPRKRRRGREQRAMKKVLGPKEHAEAIREGTLLQQRIAFVLESDSDEEVDEGGIFDPGSEGSEETESEETPPEAPKQTAKEAGKGAPHSDPSGEDLGGEGSSSGPVVNDSGSDTSSVSSFSDEEYFDLDARGSTGTHLFGPQVSALSFLPTLH